MEEELELRLLPEDRVSPELGYGSSRGGMSSSYDIYSTMTDSPRARISPSSDVRLEDPYKRLLEECARGWKTAPKHENAHSFFSLFVRSILGDFSRTMRKSSVAVEGGLLRRRRLCTVCVYFIDLDVLFPEGMLIFC